MFIVVLSCVKPTYFYFAIVVNFGGGYCFASGLEMGSFGALCKQFTNRCDDVSTIGIASNWPNNTGFK